MTITWCGHACFLLESSCGSVVFDPYAPGKVPGWELPALTADKVVCSHGHADHNWAEGVKLTGRTFTGKLTQIPSFHDDRRGALRGDNLITLVEAEDLRVVHMGDIGCITKALDPLIVIPMHYRGRGFGYAVIGTVEPFLKLAGNVKELAGMSYAVDLADAPATILFRR